MRKSFPRPEDDRGVFQETTNNEMNNDPLLEDDPFQNPPRDGDVIGPEFDPGSAIPEPIRAEDITEITDDEKSESFRKIFGTPIKRDDDSDLFDNTEFVLRRGKRKVTINSVMYRGEEVLYIKGGRIHNYGGLNKPPEKMRRRLEFERGFQRAEENYNNSSDETPERVVGKTLSRDNLDSVNGNVMIELRDRSDRHKGSQRRSTN